MATRLYVGNLPFTIPEGDILDLFKQVGNVLSCNLIVDRMTSRSKGFAFVEMSTQAEADMAISQMNGRELGGRLLTVNEARPRTDSRTNGQASWHDDGRRGNYRRQRY